MAGPRGVRGRAVPVWQFRAGGGFARETGARRASGGRAWIDTTSASTYHSRPGSGLRPARGYFVSGDSPCARRGRRAHAERRFAHQQRKTRGDIGSGENIEARGGIVGFAVTALAVSITTPPPMVTTGENMRMMKRSPGSSSAGSRRTMRRISGGAGLERREAAEQAHFRLDLRRAGVEMDRRAVLERARGGEQVEAAIEMSDGVEASGFGEHVAARDLRGLDIGQVDGGALAGDGVVGLPAVDLDTAHAQAPSGGIEFDFLLLLHGAGDERAGDDGAEAFDREDAVDGEPEVAARVFFGDGRGNAGEGGAEVVEPGAGGGTDRDDGRVFEEGAGDEFFGFEADEPEEVLIDEVGLGERDDAARNAEEAADVEVLARLGLDGLVGGDDEEHQIDAADAGEHVLDEPLMAGHVDEAEAQRGRERQVREAEVDGDAAPLFLFEAVGVDAGERLHQRGLAVIDVAGGADDDVFHAACCYSVKVLALPLLALVAGSLVYCALTILAAIRYRAVVPASAANARPISVLKPLAGVDEGLEENLRSFFEQSYPYFEILFAVRNAADPAIAVVDRLRARYPAIPSRLIVTGEPPYANAKVYSLDRMLAAANHDLLVMADSDIRVTPDMLTTMAAEFGDPELGLSTCPYRAAPGRSIWSTMEAVGLNTEFIGGVLVARMLDGMKFALGPTITARRETIEKIGGFDAVKDFLAEDFVMGKLAAEHGYGVILSSYVIEHRIGSQGLVANMKHRLRWNRSTRRSRPWGYVGQLFTNPLPLALLLWAAARSGGLPWS